MKVNYEMDMELYHSKSYVMWEGCAIYYSNFWEVQLHVVKTCFMLCFNNMFYVVKCFHDFSLAFLQKRVGVLSYLKSCFVVEWNAFSVNSILFVLNDSLILTTMYYFATLVTIIDGYD